MKKTIYLFLTALGVLSISSCRQDNDTINEPFKENQITNRSSTSKISDSTMVTPNTSEFDDGTSISDGGEGDPPPKKGGQWKIAN